MSMNPVRMGYARNGIVIAAGMENKMSDTFLTMEELSELTGIKTGKKVGKISRTREELQIEWLRTSGVPFWTNARGRPVVARVSIVGRGDAPEPEKLSWRPKVLSVMR
jgi:hypothetical protein